MNPRAVNFSLHVYEWLLAAYPRSHREEYGEAMRQLFRDQCQDAWRERRGWGLALLWLQIVPDFFKTLVLEHLENLKGKKIMPKKMFTGIRSTSSAKTAFLVVFFVVFLFVLFMATIITFILPETYASRARIKIERDVTDIRAADGKRNTTDGYDPYFIQTEIEVIQSEIILDKVIEALDLSEEWSKKYHFDYKFKTADSRVALRKMIEVRPSRNTSLIDITVYSDDRNEAAKIANAIAGAYQAYRQALRASQMERTGNFAGQKLAALEPVASIIEHAEPSAFPVRPNKPFNIFFGGVLGVMMGLLAGTVAAFVVSKFNRAERPIGAV